MTPDDERKDSPMLPNTPDEAVRLLKLLSYPHDEIVDALIKQFGLTRGAAELAASA